jgi:hypothetical protein
MKKLLIIIYCCFFSTIVKASQTYHTLNDDKIIFSGEIIGGGLYPGYIAGIAFRSDFVSLEGGWMGAKPSGYAMDNAGFAGLVLYAKPTYMNSAYLSFQFHSFALAKIDNNGEVDWVGGTAAMIGYKFFLKKNDKFSIRIAIGYDWFDKSAETENMGSVAAELKFGYTLFNL